MATITLPSAMQSWIEEAAGAAVTSAVRQAGGGRNEGWLIDLADGRRQFLRWDRSDPDETGDPWTVRREATVYRALSGTGARVAEFIGMHPTEQAVLLGVVDGDARFSLIADPEVAAAVAGDFMRCLATVHGLDAVALGIVEAGRSVADCTRDQLAEMHGVIARRGGTPTAELGIALRWLADHVPAYDGPPVLVQGDTGPGNFMFRGDQVAAIVDWELAHPGDPMDDLAWVSLRSTQEPFPDLPGLFQEYAEVSGNAIDLDRIRYYRVLAEAKIAVMGHGRGGSGDDGDGGDTGARLIFGQLHRRLLVEALGAAMGIDVDTTTVDVPSEAAERPEWHSLYDVVLGQLKDVISPRITDGFALQRTKGAARIIRHLQAIDLHGRTFADAELADLAGVLGARPSGVGASRRELAERVHAGTIDAATALGTVARRVARDEELLRSASGVLATRHYDPLTRFNP